MNSNILTENVIKAKLTFLEKFSYGVGSGAEILMANTIIILANPVYYLGLGIRPEWLGLILLSTKLFDAFIDPTMGHISDNTRWRWGRRKPYILLGAVLTGIFCFMMWRPPAMSTHGYLWYFLIVAIIYYTSYTIFYAPYNALGYEMTNDYDERMSLMAYKWGIGSAIGLLILPCILPLCYGYDSIESAVKAGVPDFLAGALVYLSATLHRFSEFDPQNAAVGARVLGPVVGLLILFFALAPSFIPRERVIHQEKMPFLEALTTTMRNKPFLLLCGIIVFCLTGILAMLQLRQLLNMAYIFQMNERTSASMVMWFDYTYGIINMVCMFVASSLASRFDKKKVLVVGLLLIVVGMASSWFYITPKHPYLQLLLAILTAPGMSCVWVLTNSCVADVCDYDELQTGLRREGFYGAVYAFFMKLGSALGLGLGGLILYLVGFDKELTAQSAETIIRFRWVFAIVPAAFFVGAVVLAIKYPITKQKLLEVQRQLASRKNQQA